MIGPVADFLRRHYMTGPDGLLVAGAEVAAARRSAGGRWSTSWRPGPYLLAFTPRGSRSRSTGLVTRRGWLALAPGPHEVTWLGARRHHPPHGRDVPGAAGPGGARRLTRTR